MHKQCLMARQILYSNEFKRYGDSLHGMNIFSSSQTRNEKERQWPDLKLAVLVVVFIPKSRATLQTSCVAAWCSEGEAQEKRAQNNIRSNPRKGKSSAENLNARWIKQLCSFLFIEFEDGDKRSIVPGTDLLFFGNNT
ncbi:hypothetical protein WA026_003968 [Henosepilachna vigintioctopunctata]|uniref:Uncharacterized protein n=1 Tax=Henosepilachna vigintioctopunctata TaxID=420089 RepID=A0AAW1UG58_9CUCU